MKNNNINKQTNTFHSTSQNKIKNKINFKKNMYYFATQRINSSKKK